jgi:nucleoside-diphosphate-sugar epimerase
MTEEDTFDLGLPDKLREMLGAIRHVEDAVTGAGWTEGLVLRYGNFYGPSTSMAPDGEHFEMIGKRKFPLVGSGAGVWSFVHIEDAAEATVAAVERGDRGIYNIVDEEPAAVAEWLPALASALGAAPPPGVPRWLGPVACWRGSCCHDDRGPGGLERKGEARVGLAPESSELA